MFLVRLGIDSSGFAHWRARTLSDINTLGRYVIPSQQQRNELKTSPKNKGAAEPTAAPYIIIA
jgi:hypothetical protein